MTHVTVSLSTPVSLAIDLIMSRSHPVINGEGWNFKAYDIDGKVTHYQVTDVMIEGVK